jgi:endonuclease III
MIRKAAALKAFVAFLDEFYAGSMERFAAEAIDIARTRLLALPGVGPETADAILLYAFGQPAFVVDEYLRRIVTRHGLLHEKANYPEIQQLAVSAFRTDKPAERPTHYNEFHALIVNAGKLHCGPKPRCEKCPLAFDLPKERTQLGAQNAVEAPATPQRRMPHTSLLRRGKPASTQGSEAVIPSESTTRNPSTHTTSRKSQTKAS